MSTSAEVCCVLCVWGVSCVDNAVEYVSPHVVAPLDGWMCLVVEWLVVYAIMLMSVCVPHSVPPGWVGDVPWTTCHGPGVCWRSQRN